MDIAIDVQREEGQQETKQEGEREGEKINKGECERKGNEEVKVHI